jgi:hypothetical protein
MLQLELATTAPRLILSIVLDNSSPYVVPLPLIPVPLVAFVGPPPLSLAVMAAIRGKFKPHKYGTFQYSLSFHSAYFYALHLLYVFQSASCSCL